MHSYHSLINNPDASVGVCCSHKVVAVGFNTLCYDAACEITLRTNKIVVEKYNDAR